MSNRLLIGISVCLMPPDPDRKVVPRKTLQFIEQSTAHWVAAGGAIPVLIPSPFGETSRGLVNCSDYAKKLDGLVLHGGSDVWPGHYGEVPIKPEWVGDRARDVYEIELTKAFVKADKPVFGICRGLQIINVAFGGTLYQDVFTQIENVGEHRNHHLYEKNIHEVTILPNTKLAQLLPDSERIKVNSIHHQGIKDLASGFTAEAIAPDDNLIEAIRSSDARYIAGVQWHPEMHQSSHGVVDDLPLLLDFLAAAMQRRENS